MKINNKKLRGVTLTEVIIVLAVIAIISTIVISFIVVSNENVRISSQKVDALNDITVVESLIDGWFSTEMDNLSSEYFEENEERKRIDIVSNRDDINYLKFDGIKIYSKINGDESYYQPESITNIEIIFENDDINGRLAICYITYQLVLSNDLIKEYTYSFIVYPYKSIDTITQGGQ